MDKNEKKPFSVYSEIYSCKSNGFISKNEYTFESIDKVISVLNRKSNMVFDRGYDDNKIINYIDETKNFFVIRMNDRRVFLFKGKKKMHMKKQLKEKVK